MTTAPQSALHGSPEDEFFASWTSCRTGDRSRLNRGGYCESHGSDFRTLSERGRRYLLEVVDSPGRGLIRFDQTAHRP